MLEKDIISIKGVGKKYADLFSKNNIKTIENLIMYFPKSYEFVGDYLSDKCIFEGIVTEILRDATIRAKLVITTIKLRNYEGRIAKLIYFNKPYMKHSFILGNTYKVYGTCKETKNYIEIVNAEKIKDFSNNIIPKYKSIKGIGNNQIINIVRNVLGQINLKDNLPDIIVKKRNLISLNDALINIHLPKNKELLTKAIYRFKYQELMYFFINTKLLRDKLSSKESGIKFKIFTEELIELKKELGFQLTGDQNNAIKRILIEQKGDFSINRLLHGDVGSGKTIVAFITAFNVLLNGYKVALIVPTEILAVQHYDEAIKLFKKFNIQIRLLVGSVKEKQKNEIKQELNEETPILLIGTHAILEDNVEFKNLGYIIFDEQHRFGVSQRSKLIQKGKDKNCDVLVMTATPIPRTLFLYIYNGMDISSIRELPSNRKKVNTIHIKSEDKEAKYKIMLDEINKGGQCYMVCPLIEENEKMDLFSVESLYEELKTSILSCCNIGILHGKMKNKDKNEVMNCFKEGLIDILISTTVIEVGISVSNATVMVIENAERFGISQIHQLRGRIGRGSKEGTCILVTSSMNPVTMKRISTLLESNDGFYLSEQDLKIRGSGDVFGYKQHGNTGFVFADVINDVGILKKVKEDIEYMDQFDIDEIRDFYDSVQKKLDKIDNTICFN
ncbi:ATP-dependent DNA helicase RecG [Candidatus Arthromitus sp. SFB-rat-Yit]|uniref:ATP-dependent DNA helicase RecG n=1 Tax=Candidatus Arthromitus sp. SFB-rat-Yit TaxID=1041504 RepID=UPI000227A65C|nr:ATP-dependent DNA helicase RecG [Candidatus Arthromitus sp. SFB-rat-Yit]BAK81075.1 ATP-dependent DNA helicase RecG [Candidatus Arthromitus sp. SFB-rat-Yit]